MVAAMPLLSALMPATPGDGAQPAAAPTDAAAAFAAMLAGVGQTPASPVALVVKANADTQDSDAEAQDADPGTSDKQDSAGSDDPASLILALPMADAGWAAQPILAQAGKGDAQALSSRRADISAAALLASRQTMAKGAAQVSTTPADAAEEVASADEAAAVTGQDGQSAAPSSGKDAGRGDGKAADTLSAPTAQLLADRAAVTAKADTASQQQTAPADPTKASMQAAQANTDDTARLSRTRDAAAPTKKTASARDAGKVKDVSAADASADATASDSATAASTAPAAPTASPSVKAAEHSATIVGAGQTLAASGSDRQIDLARSHAWLDGLARDISNTADPTGTVRFQVAPERLGTLHVELNRGDDGASVKITAASESARAALDDAKPQLVAEAHAHGIRITDTQIDVGGASVGSGQTGSQQNDGAPRDQNSPQNQHGGHSGAGFSDGSDGSRQSQARAQQEQQQALRPMANPHYGDRNPSEGKSAGDDARPSRTTTTQDSRYA